MRPEEWASLLAWTIAGVAVLVALGAWRALRRTGNPNIRFVVAAFALLSFKSGVKAWHITLGPEPLAWEIAFSLTDLAVVSLIAWPLLRAWGRRAA